MASNVTYKAPNIAGVARARLARPLAVLLSVIGLGLALGACSKCDVPNLLPHQSGPQYCHDGPAPQ